MGIVVVRLGVVSVVMVTERIMSVQIFCQFT
jgi:hypothetical protein